VGEKVQLAFQGGGARLAQLLPIAEAVSELRTKKKIEISRVAGTSAGAIIAVLLAAEANVPAFVQYCCGLDAKKLRGVFPAKGSLAARSLLTISRGETLGNLGRFKSLLFEAFHAAGVNAHDHISALEIPALIVAANVDRQKAVLAESDV
jgi:predicted acylesterase/phospholipase RssA